MIEIETVNLRQEFSKQNGIDSASAYVEVVLKVPLIESDLFEQVFKVENRVRTLITEKLK